MAENRISTRLSITRKSHRYQPDADLLARFICHANTTHVLQSLWRGLLGEGELWAYSEADGGMVPNVELRRRKGYVD